MFAGFFKYHVGDEFRFNRDFMTWVNTNTGIAMQEAIEEARHRKMANG